MRKSFEFLSGARCLTSNEGVVNNALHVLWVGRLLDWKCVDTIVRAVAMLRGRASLTVVGDGPEQARLLRLAGKLEAPVSFRAAVSPDRVRELMRDHDVFVLSSNAIEGWGATISEAMCEGMCVVGTYEAGASAALLPEGCLFHSGKFQELARILEGLARLKLAGTPFPKKELPREFTPVGAAEKLMEMI